MTETQQIIDHIFTVLGGPTEIANGTHSRVQTVCDWRKKAPAEIPPWRRPAVLQFARNSGKVDELSAEARAYLASDQRTVGKSSSTPDTTEARAAA